MISENCNNCCCDHNRITCKRINDGSKINSNIVPPNTEKRIKLFLALKFDFYKCELTNFNVNQDILKERLKDRNIPINNNHWYVSCDYDGRDSLLDHFRMGWCIVHYTDGVVYDTVDMVS